jgi:hypothetical protein
VGLNIIISSWPPSFEKHLNTLVAMIKRFSYS